MKGSRERSSSRLDRQIEDSNFPTRIKHLICFIISVSTARNINLKTTMVDKSVATLGSKIRFLSVSPLPPKTHG